jgi:formylmethanofuran:tetrahydromethanopterin formyltransferase
MSVALDTKKFRTSDMVLATLLYMKGNEYHHELDLHTRRGVVVRTCMWVFDAPEHEADKREFNLLISHFEDGKCNVEPRQFATNWANVRRAMFSFLHPDGRA